MPFNEPRLQLPVKAKKTKLRETRVLVTNMGLEYICYIAGGIKFSVLSTIIGRMVVNKCRLMSELKS